VFGTDASLIPRRRVAYHSLSDSQSWISNPQDMIRFGRDGAPGCLQRTGVRRAASEIPGDWACLVKADCPLRPDD
jgi:hypothetical protein